MAERIRKKHQDEPARFYVYEIMDGEIVHYVGKGSGRRLKNQMRYFSMQGHIVRRFKNESDAYIFERVHIANTNPVANKCSGGNGSRASKIYRHSDKFSMLCRTLGTKAVAARIALNFPWLVDKDKVEELRMVAYG